MDNSTLKRLAAAGALVGALLVGGVSLAGAQEADDSTTTVPEDSTTDSTTDDSTTDDSTDDSTTETPGDREGCDEAEAESGTGTSSGATSST